MSSSRCAGLCLFCKNATNAADKMSVVKKRSVVNNTLLRKRFLIAQSCGHLGCVSVEFITRSITHRKYHYAKLLLKNIKCYCLKTATPIPKGRRKLYADVDACATQTTSMLGALTKVVQILATNDIERCALNPEP